MTMKRKLRLATQIKRVIPKGKRVLFVCVGTDRSTGDSLGPLVGTALKKSKLDVLGTLDDPVHALNISETLSEIERNYPNHFVIAIDACLGAFSSVGNIEVACSALKPGAGVGKDLPPLGDVNIQGIVNVGGFMEYFVLQNTRLSMVMKMASTIADACEEAVRGKKNRRANKGA
ncbi:spore protease YyaC [Brevibacillus brevis]|uniref:Spore protease YyaC n=1 Tax=Brevibacillus brevis TaxID=1393 RepID=A0A517IAF5_BREBE|nr:spore protease YyaC [Brevibacillus brevis]QDS35870.1 spore protease YyaC [Brevibacillus brevis]